MAASITRYLVWHSGAKDGTQISRSQSFSAGAWGFHYLGGLRQEWNHWFQIISHIDLTVPYS